MRKSKSNNAFTIVEMSIVIVLLVLVISMFAIGIRLSGQGARSMQAAEISAKIRNLSVILGRELSLATEFIYPNQADDVANYVVYQNNKNELVGIYTRPDGKLMSYNRTIEKFLELGRNVTKFEVTRIDIRLLEYEVESTLYDKATGAEKSKFRVKNKLSTSNTLP